MARRMLRFWLDDTKSDQKLLVDYVKILKKEYRFAATLRNGLLLMKSLQDGDITLLIRLFPWVKDALQTAPATTEANADIMQELKRLNEYVSSLKAGGSAPIAPRPSSSSDADLSLEIDVSQASSGDEKPAYNMLLSTLGIGAKIENLPQDVIRYGIEKGKLPPSAKKYLNDEAAPSIEPDLEEKHEGLRVIAGADVTFEAEEIDLDAFDF